MKQPMQAEYQANTEEAASKWLSRDPLGEGIGPNLYGYVGNNPVNAFDLLGLAATINMGGAAAYATNASELLTDLQGAPDGSITNITVDGHGNWDTQGIDYDDSDGSIILNGNSIILSSSYQLDSSDIDITALLRKKMAPHSTIDFNGCHTGDNGSRPDTENPSKAPNLAQGTSSALPGVGVTGGASNTYTYGNLPVDTATNGTNSYYTK